MKTQLLIVISLTTVFAVSVSIISKDRNDKQFKVVCFWSSWSYYRTGDGQFTTDDIDPKICTHLVYNFAKLNSNHTIDVYDPYLDIINKENQGIGAYNQFNLLRKKNPNLTTIIAINGWNYKHISTLADSQTTRKIFIDSVKNFLNKHGFDGFELTWEYPGFESKNDKPNLILLLEEMHSMLKTEGFVLSIRVSVQKKTIDAGYDVSHITKYVDFINLLTYDFHDSDTDILTKPNAPLGHKTSDSADDQQLNVEFAVNYWIKEGAEPKKLILGIPLFGNTYTLNSSLQNGWESRILGPGNAGNFTKSPGVLGYNEICELLHKDNNQWVVKKDADYKVPYLVNGNQFISYDDLNSVKEKLIFLKKKGLGGAMVMSIDTDDFHNNCNDGRNPMTSLIMKELNQI